MFSMYALLKFIHVTAAIIWVGGAIAITVLNARLAREQDQGALVALARQAGFYGQAVLGPAAITTLVAGIATALTVGFPFESLWITWGFAGVFGSILLGSTFIRRTYGEMAQLIASSGPDTMRLGALQSRLWFLNLANLLLLLSTVWAMVFKPTL